MSVLPTYYQISDLSGRVFAHILSDDPDVIEAAVIAGVRSWLNEILYVPRDEIRGRPDEIIKIEIRT